MFDVPASAIAKKLGISLLAPPVMRGHFGLLNPFVGLNARSPSGTWDSRNFVFMYFRCCMMVENFACSVNGVLDIVRFRGVVSV